ncbi:unnamed protein product, partial [marine sediment metagenome]
DARRRAGPGDPTVSAGLGAVVSARRVPVWLVAFATVLLAIPSASGEGEAADKSYSVRFDARIVPTERLAKVSIRLGGEASRVRWLRFSIDPERHFAFRGEGRVEVDGESVLWEPPRSGGRLSYSFWIDHLRNTSSYDARCAENWALFRGDDMVPPVRVRTVVGAHSISTLRLRVPDGWSAALPYERLSNGTFAIDDPHHRFDRPKGWMVAGKIGVLRERIAGTHVAVAGPVGQRLRRHDILALLRWTLPALRKIVGEFPDRIQVVSAGDPMWRGGLSGPKSVFVHADRPLISTDLSSPVLHELMHTVMGASSGADGDWVVEGLAELYSLELLARSKTVSRRRYANAMLRLKEKSRGVASLAAEDSGGAVTARAVVVLGEIDEQIKVATGGESGLDEVVRRLSAERGVVSSERFRHIA